MEKSDHGDKPAHAPDINGSLPGQSREPGISLYYHSPVRFLDNFLVFRFT